MPPRTSYPIRAHSCGVTLTLVEIAPMPKDPAVRGVLFLAAVLVVSVVAAAIIAAIFPA